MKGYLTHKMPTDRVQSDTCFCVGPQNGEPLCPCRMKRVKVRDGRYVLPERDLGPAQEERK